MIKFKHINYDAYIFELLQEKIKTDTFQLTNFENDILSKRAQISRFLEDSFDGF